MPQTFLKPLDYKSDFVIDAIHPTIRQYQKMAGTSSIETDTHFALYPYERHRFEPIDEIELKKTKNKKSKQSTKMDNSLLPGNFGCRFAEKIPTDFHVVFKERRTT